MRLLFVHGWALDRTLWVPVLKLLGGDSLVNDAGYYGRPARPPIEGPILGVGHSLGVLELLAAPPPGLKAVVAIDGMARFGQAADFPLGVPGRVLARMRKRVADGVLAEFIARAGGAVPAGAPDFGRLQQGLDKLEILDGRACRLPVWRLQAEGDPIAALAMSDASFDGLDVRERRIRPSTDHLSPLHDPGACADLIRTARKALS